jgi:hypothetical protein
LKNILRSHFPQRTKYDLPLILSIIIFSCAASSFLLSFIPLYYKLDYSFNEAGNLGLPSFPEIPEIGLSPHIWPLHELNYQISGTEDTVFSARVKLGDYIILMVEDSLGRKYGVRASIQAQVPSALLVFENNKKINGYPVDSKILKPGQPQTLMGWIYRGKVRFYINNSFMGVLPIESAPKRWILSTGLQSMQLIDYSIGNDPLKLESYCPYFLKLFPFLINTILLSLFFISAIPKVSKFGRLFFLTIFIAGTLIFFSSSIAGMALAYFSIYFIFGMLILKWAASFYRLTKERHIQSLKKSAGLTVFLLSFVAIHAALMITSTIKAGVNARVSRDNFTCQGTTDSIEQGPLPRLFVIGASTVAGQGLLNPSVDSFICILKEHFKDLLVVDHRGRHGAGIDNLIEMIKETDLRKGDIVVSYLTFNESLYTQNLMLKYLISSLYIKNNDAFGFSFSEYMKDSFEEYGDTFGQKLKTLLKEINSSGAIIIFVEESSADQIIYNDSSHGLSRYQETMEKIADETGAMYIGFGDKLIDSRDDFIFVDPVHLNAHGHYLLASAVIDAISEMLGL